MAEQALQISGFHHLAVKAHDFDASLKFYIEGIGLTQAISWGEGESRAAMLSAGNGNFIELFAGGQKEQPAESVLLHFALRTNDCAAAFKRAVAAGAQVHMAPQDVTIASQPAPVSVCIAFVKGPDGELIEFFQSDMI